MVLGKLPMPGRPTIWIIVGHELIALAVGEGWGCLEIFTLLYPFSPLPPSLWETTRYRLKYSKGRLTQNNQPTKRPTADLALQRHMQIRICILKFCKTGKISTRTSVSAGLDNILIPARGLTVCNFLGPTPLDLPSRTIKYGLTN